MTMSGALNLRNVKNYNRLPRQVKLLFLIWDEARPDGTVEMSKDYCGEYIKATAQTAGTYLAQYVNSNIIKYKYSGKIMVNPDVYYKGKEEDRENVRRAYAEFKSDM